MSEWISVEDRLPDEYLDVLCYDKNRAESIGYRSTESGWEISCDDRMYIPQVTHWMELPEPPNA